MTAFRYMGQVMTARDDDWPTVVGNPQRDRNSWGRLSRILIREGADPKVSVHFFKAVTQAVLLFSSDTWVVTPRMERGLSSFQHRVAQRLTGRQPRRQGVGFENTHHWRNQWWKQDSRGSVHTSRGGRTRSRSIF